MSRAHVVSINKPDLSAITSLEEKNCKKLSQSVSSVAFSLFPKF